MAVFEKVQEIIVEELGKEPSEVTLESTFEDLEADSLDLFQVISEIEDAFDIEIEGIKIRWNCKQENWVGLGVEDPKIAHEMGVIHSIQGYDLSYAYVVIGPDLIYDEINKRVTVSRKDYYDKNGKNTATLQELEDYIKHIYYVLLTRGIYGTHIYVCDKKLRTYMSRFFR